MINESTIIEKEEGMATIIEQEKLRPKRHSINLNSEVFTKLSTYIAKWGNTKEGVVNMAVDDYVEGREKFGKMLAPHLTLESSSPTLLTIYDRDLQKRVVVVAKWNNISKSNNNHTRSLLSLYCENCEVDNCVHVRYSLVLPDVIRIRKVDKLV